jgi:hypothetical protein
VKPFNPLTLKRAARAILESTAVPKLPAGETPEEVPAAAG